MSAKIKNSVLSSRYTKIHFGVIFLFFLVDYVWISFSSLSLIHGREATIEIMVFLSIFLVPYLFYILFFKDEKILLPLLSTFVFLLFSQVMFVFSYLVATLNYPLIDSNLALVDSVFKINSSTIVSWFRENKDWHTFFEYIYDSFIYQPIFIIFYFSYKREILILQRFIMQFMIALVITLILSALLPALGPYIWYHYTPNSTLASALAQLIELREGILDISKRNGIVTFPSFHAVLALIYTYTFRQERKLIFIPILTLNLLMIFSCLPIGEHYFADILGAVPLFIATIWSDNLIYKYVVQKNTHA